MGKAFLALFMGIVTDGIQDMAAFHVINKDVHTPKVHGQILPVDAYVSPVPFAPCLTGGFDDKGAKDGTVGEIRARFFFAGQKTIVSPGMTR